MCFIFQKLLSFNIGIILFSCLVGEKGDRHCLIFYLLSWLFTVIVETSSVVGVEQSFIMWKITVV